MKSTNRMQYGLLALMVGCVTVALGDSSEIRGRTSLTNKPYVHPRLVEELVSSVSDGGDQIVALDLDDSEGSDRFCCDDAYGQRHYRRGPDEDGFNYHTFEYWVVGQTVSGVYVIKTANKDDGTASWHDLIFVVIENNPGLDITYRTVKAEMTRPRRVMRKLGQIFLGDKWKGQLKVEGNTLYIGKDHGWYSDEVDYEEVKERNDWERIIEINYNP